ncbi:MAG: ATP-binding protein [Thermomicrobiales bacterium]
MSSIFPRPDLPVRVRIALTIFALSAGVLLLAAFTTWRLLATQLEAFYQQTLAQESAANLALVSVEHGTPHLPPLPDPSGLRARGTSTLRLYDRSGLLLQDDSPITGASSEEAQVVRRAIVDGQPVAAIVDLEDDEDYGVIGEPIFDGGKVAGVLVTGLERSQVTTPLERLRLTLLSILPATAALLGLGAFAIARRALRPVHEMAAAAERITGGDLGQRLSEPTQHDELGELATTLNRMLGRLAATTERERRFTADAAHELRTPLAAMSTALDVTLARDRDAAAYRDALETVGAQTTRMSGLVDRLLLLARLDGDDARRRFGIVDLAGAAREACADAAARFPGVRFAPTLPAAPLLVEGDDALLGSAIRNLLDNAAIHGGPSARIALDLSSSPGSDATLLVCDNGPGIPPGAAADLFQRFRRGDASRATQGSGLGLAIVADVARVHGGEAFHRDPPSENGACFGFTVPVLGILPGEVGE